MSNRLKFSLGHLATSILIALTAIVIVFYFWYPTPLAKAVDVTHIFLMVLGIDVIIGPVLGFFIYKEGKKTLKIDLTIIILVQLAALLYGLFSIFEGRPAWLVYNVDRFELVRNNDIVHENLNQALPQFQNSSWLKPQYVAVEFAKNPKQRNNDMFAEVLGGISIAQRPERYVPLVQATAQIQKRRQKLELLQQYNDKDSVVKILNQYPQATAFVPLKASHLDMAVLLDKKGNVVKIVDLRPWK